MLRTVYRTMILLCCVLVWALAVRAELPRSPMQEKYIDSLRFRWLNKPVEQFQVLHSMENLRGWSASGIGQVELTRDRSIDGISSLRFRTPLRDEELIARTPGGRMMGSAAAVLKFDTPQDWSAYNRVFLWVYVHPTNVRVHTFYLTLTCQDAPAAITDPPANSVIQGLTVGEWNPVFWEIPQLHRDQVTEFRIMKLLTGNDPNEGGHVIYDFDGLTLQKIATEQYEGWEVAPGRIAYNHAGYTPEQSKIAIASDLDATHFQLLEACSSRVVLTGRVRNVENGLGRFQVLDFSSVREPGKYFLWAGQRTTRPFSIGDDLWLEPIRKTLNCYYALRCGHDVPGIHPACHGDCQGTYKGETKVINGGWHDAGDLSQGSFRTAMSVYAMIDLLRQLEKRNADASLRENLLGEALWGLDWVLKTRFADGYRITWNSMGIYTDGILGTTDDVLREPQNNPWENFVCSAAEAMAGAFLKERDSDLARKCLQAAREDWEEAVKRKPEWLDQGKVVITGGGVTDNQAIFSHRWFSGGTYLTLSWGILSSIHLYQVTGDDRYAREAIEYAGYLRECQERSFPDGIPLTGFFYTSSEKLAIVNHRHGAFEESPLLALAALCEAFPDHEDWIEWYGAAVLHSEYLSKQGVEFTEPYRVLPAAVFRKSDILKVPEAETREAMLRQFQEGTRLSNEYCLRKFPIWSTRSHHGNVAVGLSQTLALASAARLRSDPASEDLAARQIQWLLGGNPFSQSLMFGEGYDYPPLYGYNPGDIVGALPVGMDCVGGDAPFWSASNHSTFKEIWVVPVSRFLWNASYLGVPALVRGEVKNSVAKSVTFVHRAMNTEKEVSLNASGMFAAQLPAGDYEIRVGSSSWRMAMVSGGNYSLSLDAQNSIALEVRRIDQDPEGNRIGLQAIISGEGKHVIQLRLFNGQTDREKVRVELAKGKPETLQWEVMINEPQSPWVAVVVPNNRLAYKRELTGVLAK